MDTFCQSVWITFASCAAVGVTHQTKLPLNIATKIITISVTCDRLLLLVILNVVMRLLDSCHDFSLLYKSTTTTIKWWRY